MNIRDLYKQYSAGGQVKNYQEGGLVSGDGAMPHEEGGVPTVDGSGEQIAEVEGGERIFSIEDTQQMEQMAAQLMETQDEALAAELGFFVAQAIMKQEEVNPSEPSPEDMGGMESMGGMEGDMGGGMPMEQPMMKRGGKFNRGFSAVELDY